MSDPTSFLWADLFDSDSDRAWNRAFDAEVLKLEEFKFEAALANSPHVHLLLVGFAARDYALVRDDQLITKKLTALPASVEQLTIFCCGLAEPSPTQRELGQLVRDQAAAAAPVAFATSARNIAELAQKSRDYLVGVAEKFQRPAVGVQSSFQANYDYGLDRL